MEALADALERLLQSGEVRLYVGPWDGESHVVATADALRMVREPRRYRYQLDDPHEERLSFVNVENDRSHPE